MIILLCGCVWSMPIMYSICKHFICFDPHRMWSPSYKLAITRFFFKRVNFKGPVAFLSKFFAKGSHLE